jgi:hypothetical protein
MLTSIAPMMPHQSVSLKRTDYSLVRFAISRFKLLLHRAHPNHPRHLSLG